FAARLRPARLPVLLVLDVPCRAAVEADPGGERVRPDVQVRAVAVRLDVAERGGGAPPVPGGEIPVSRPVRARPVEVVVPRDAEDLDRRGDERVRERVLPARQLDADGTVPAVVL